MRAYWVIVRVSEIVHKSKQTRWHCRAAFIVVVIHSQIGSVELGVDARPRGLGGGHVRSALRLVAVDGG